MDMRISKKQRSFISRGVFFCLIVFFFWFVFLHKKAVVPSAELVLSVVYDKADGLNVGAPVRLAGIEVGKVSALKLNPYFGIEATLSFPRFIELPVDSAAKIETDGIVGSKYIELSVGGEEDFLKSGDSFMYKQDVLLLDELLDRFVSWMRVKKGL